MLCYISMGCYNTWPSWPQQGNRPTHLAIVLRPIPFIDPNHNIKQKTNPLIARPFSGNPNCVCQSDSPVWGQGIPLTPNINVAHLSSSRSNSLSMTRFRPSFELITFPTLSRCATYYVTDAGLQMNNNDWLSTYNSLGPLFWCVIYKVPIILQIFQLKRTDQ